MRKLFDRYSLVARIYPTTLALGPVLWTALVLFPRLVSNSRLGAASTLAVGCVLYLLAALARSRGKIVEQKLIAAWGGWPTTILLRHRDPSLDPITKARYHQALAALAAGPLPTPAEEAVSPNEADDAYRSATKRLIELRRGKEYQLLLDENASYGFRRNLLGLRAAAVMIAALAALATALDWWAGLPNSITLVGFEASISQYPYLPALLLADVAYLAMFVLMIDGNFVRQAADEYALALFRTLDADSAPANRGTLRG